MKKIPESDLMNALPPRTEDLKNVQARVPVSLYREVDRTLREDGLTWRDLITAALTVYRDAKAKGLKRR